MNKATVNIADIFDDIPISDQEKNELTGIYLASMYKTMLELSIAFNGNKKDFVTDLDKFFQKSLSALNEKQRAAFDEELENQKKTTLKKIVDIIKSNVSGDIANKLDENYDRLQAKLATQSDLE